MDDPFEELCPAPDAPITATGSASTLNITAGRPRRVPKRAFPPGFHVAAPGQSHPDPDDLPKIRRPTAKKKARK